MLWYVFGIHHITRMEDWPIMPVDTVSFWLKPFGFFDRNPTLDVPPQPSHCEHYCVTLPGLLRGRTRWRLAFAGAGIAALLATASVGDAAMEDPTCFGAAARDPQRPCVNPALERTVQPTPAQARTLPNSACRPIRGSQPPVCSFGAADGPVVALVGDSHAGHWRGALDDRGPPRAGGDSRSRIRAARCRRRCAICVSRGERTAGAGSATCSRGSRPILRSSTVFVAGLTGGSGVVARPGRSRFETSVQGYADAWRALPATVRTIVVIRDTPKMLGRHRHAACSVPSPPIVPRAARARSRPAARSTAIPRWWPPPGSPRRASAPWTSRRFFCGSECYPVVGGALVLRDSTHMTGTYSTTLGPYLLREVDAVMAR